ncbi:hypothetical protein [uncultured Reyranella sp.]|uniref:WapI family immunity protein n=1 Tax=uncultured Reyranella sp. TaxID=735512 RepID=UPI0025E2D81C|nr:hypothetical protein [uncultured Reyranella sp.]
MKKAREQEPDMQIAGLHLWVLGREFPDSEDYWDGNWLQIEALVETPSATVRISGPCLRTDEVAGFTRQLEELYANLQGTAELNCMEPNLRLKATCDKSGKMELFIEITPDHLTQKHQFTFSIDQSYLPETLNGCRQILERFPVKGSPG